MFVLGAIVVLLTAGAMVFLALQLGDANDEIEKLTEAGERYGVL